MEFSIGGCGGHSSQKITAQTDGGILFEIEVSEPKEVGWWVLQWGAEAEVLEPESLRLKLQETAAHLLDLYRRSRETAKDGSI